MKKRIWGQALPGQSSYFICLSHCWVHHQTQKGNSEEVSDYSDSISFFFLPFKISFYQNLLRTPLVVQEIRMYPPRRCIQSLAWEDPTCCRATEPRRHDHWGPRACSLHSTPRGDAAVRSPPTAPGGHLPVLTAVRESQQAATKIKINQNSLS